ncbi:MAG: hypothetical protein AAFX06_14980 [Planctomycetota bacterium]
MKNRILVALLLVSSVIVGCSGGEKFTKENWSKLKIGMTYEEVVEIIGTPDVVQEGGPVTLPSQEEFREKYQRSYQKMKESGVPWEDSYMWVNKPAVGTLIFDENDCLQETACKYGAVAGEDHYPHRG